MIDDRAMYTVNLQWDQEVREQVCQDESRSLGKQRVESKVNVIARSQELAEKAVMNEFRHHRATIVGITVKTPIHLIVDYSVAIISSVSNERVLEPIR